MGNKYTGVYIQLYKSCYLPHFSTSFHSEIETKSLLKTEALTAHLEVHKVSSQVWSVSLKR